MRNNGDVKILSLSGQSLAAFLNSPDKSTRLVFTILQLYSACTHTNKKVENSNILGKVVGNGMQISGMHFVDVDFSSVEGLENLFFNSCRFDRCTFQNSAIQDVAIQCCFSECIFEEQAEERSLSSLSRGFFEERKSIVSKDNDSQLSNETLVDRAQFALATFDKLPVF